MVKDGFKEEENQGIVPFEIGDLGMFPTDNTGDIVPQSDVLDAYRDMPEVVDSREAYETAEIVPDQEVTKRYAKEIFELEEPPKHITIVGKDSETAAKVAYDLAKARHADDCRGSDEPKTTNVLNLNFGIKKSSLPQIAQEDGKKAVDSNLLDENGILTYLSPREQGEVFASSFGEKRDDQLQIERIYTTVADALVAARKENMGDDYQPSLEEMRDAMEILDGARVTQQFDEAPSLKNPQARKAVELSLRAEFIKENKKGIRIISDHLNSMLPRGSQSKEVSNLRTDPNLDNDIVVTNIGVSGRGASLADQQSTLSTLSIPLITDKSPLGKPEVVVIEHANNMPPRDLAELEAHCDAQSITLISARTEVDVEKSRTGDLFIIGNINTPQIASSVSKLIGEEYSSQIESSSWGASVNRSPNTPGWSVNLEDDGSIKGGSVSGSSSVNEGGSWNVGESKKWGDNPIVPATALGKIAVGEIVVVTPFEQPLGIFDVESGDKKGDFPPLREPEISNMEQKVLKIVNEIEPKALEEGGQYLQPNQVRDVVRGKSNDGLHPRQRLESLLGRYRGDPEGGNRRGGLKSVQPLALVHPDAKAKTDHFLVKSWVYWEKDLFEGKHEMGFVEWGKHNGLSDRDIKKSRRLVQRDLESQGHELPRHFYFGDDDY